MASLVTRSAPALLALTLWLGAAPTVWADAPQAGAGKRAAAGGELRLRVGQTARAAGGRLKVRFASVEEDSRCPAGVSCVWAGNAKIRLVLQAGRGRPATVELNTGVDPKVADALGYEISLKSLHPYPRADAETKREQYTATLAVRRK